METKGYLSILNHHKRISHTYVMRLRRLEMFYFFNAGTDFRRQNLTSVDISAYMRMGYSTQRP